jgi:hypothetical protein
MKTVPLEDLIACGAMVAQTVVHDHTGLSCSCTTGGPQGRKTFLRYARGSLRFHGKLIEPKRWNIPRDKRVNAFRHYLRVELGFADQTIDNRTWMLNRFFSWLDENQIQLRFVSLSYVERYLDRLTAIGCKMNTIAMNRKR